MIALFLGQVTFFSASSRAAPSFSMLSADVEKRAMAGQHNSRGTLPAISDRSFTPSPHHVAMLYMSALMSS